MFKHRILSPMSGTSRTPTTGTERDLMFQTSSPAQPDPKFMVVQKRANCVLSFQQKWFTTFPWLHNSATLQGVICFHCAKVFLNQSTFASKCNPAFVSVGFRNWKKAIQKFSEHAKSQLHIHAMNICAQKGNTVASQLSSAVARQQEEARYGLRKECRLHQILS